jgi:hypothetical protein
MSELPRQSDWTVISRQEYDQIVGSTDDLQVFATITDPEGVYGPAQVYTAWGRRGDDDPLVDIRDWKDGAGATVEQVCRRFVGEGWR